METAASLCGTESDSPRQPSPGTAHAATTGVRDRSETAVHRAGEWGAGEGLQHRCGAPQTQVNGEEWTRPTAGQ